MGTPALNKPATLCPISSNVRSRTPRGITASVGTGHLLASLTITTAAVSTPSRPPGGAATPRRFVTCRSRFRLRRFCRVPPKRAHQPADHVGGRENDDGAKRDGYLRDEHDCVASAETLFIGTFSICSVEDGSAPSGALPIALGGPRIQPTWHSSEGAGLARAHVVTRELW